MKWFLKHKAVSVFLGSFILFLLVSLVVNQSNYPFDAHDYFFKLGKSFKPEGASFSLYNFPESFRGVLFPLLLFLVKGFGSLPGLNSFVAYMLLASITAAGLVACLPVLFSPFLKKEPGLSARFLPALLILLFWRGLILYPLSDLFSFSALLFGLCIFTKLLFAQKRKWFVLVPGAMLAGALFYFAYNTRTIYLFPVIFVVLALVVLSFKQGVKTMVLLMSATLIGCFGLGSLQGLVNAQQTGHFSFAVRTDAGEQTQSLFLTQLKGGILYDQYETALVDENSTHYPTPALYFVDRVGMQLLMREGIDPAGTITYGQVTRLLFKYPLDFAGIYVRHLAGMLNPVFGEVYITSFSGKVVLSITNYCLLFILCAQFFLRKKQDNAKNQKRPFKARLAAMDPPKAAGSIFIAAALLPCLFILPGAVECRFFFPFYVLLYGVFAFLSELRELWAKLRQRPVLAAIAFVIPYLILSAMWSSIYANNTADVFIGLM